MTKRVLVAGASGLVGYAAVRHFATLPGWEAVGVSRRVPVGLPPEAELLSVDLLDEEACERAFGAMSNVTHLVYAALQEIPGLMPGWVDPEVIERNARMLRNLFEPLSRAASGLEHVSLLHGTKAYGLHHPSIGAKGVRVPLREREPRREHPNFYFEQEDYLRERQAEGGWGLTTWRPTVIYGDAPGNHMNAVPVIGAYAALLREEGRALDFPGRPGAPTLREAVDADLVAHALSWATTEPAAWGETFNLTNGDVFMWENVWPAIAETLGMEAGEAAPLVAGGGDAEAGGAVGGAGRAARPERSRQAAAVHGLQLADLHGHGAGGAEPAAPADPEQHDQGAAGGLHGVHGHGGHVPQVVLAPAGDGRDPTAIAPEPGSSAYLKR